MYVIHKQQIPSPRAVLKRLHYIIGNIYTCCVGMYLHNAQTAHTTLPHTCINMTQHALANIQNIQLHSIFTLLIAQIHHNIQP